MLVGSWAPISTGREVWRGARYEISRMVIARELLLLALDGAERSSGDRAVLTPILCMRRRYVVACGAHANPETRHRRGKHT